MPNNAHTQQALASDLQFRQRVKAALSTVAWQVLAEAVDVEHHAERETYAHQVLRSLDQTAQQWAPSLVMRPNLFQFETSYDFAAAQVITASGDPDIESQVMSDWNEWAGVADETPVATRSFGETGLVETPRRPPVGLPGPKLS